MPRIRVEKPGSPEEAARILSEAFAKKSLVVLLARCSAEYTGRGRSRLGPGDRLLVVKPDGAVLLHRPTGYQPVNWQPDSKIVRAYTEDNVVVVESVRERPRELLKLYIEKIYTILVAENMVDEAEFIEFLDEAELRDYLASHPEEIEPGLRVIAKERPLGNGYADIIARDRDNNYVIIEVKRVTAGIDAVRQLKRYVDTLRASNPGAPVRGILVAPEITRDAATELAKLGLEHRRVNLRAIYEKISRRRPAAGTRSLLDFLEGRS